MSNTAHGLGLTFLVSKRERKLIEQLPQASKAAKPTPTGACPRCFARLHRQYEETRCLVCGYVDWNGA